MSEKLRRKAGHDYSKPAAYMITVTTRSEAWQRGDTSVVIQTKTVESYNAEKRL